MHPNLRPARKLLPELELPQPISDNVEGCLNMKLNNIPRGDLGFRLDAVSDACAEVVGMRLYVASIIPQVHAAMRLREKEVNQENPGIKPTPLERVLKTDPRYIELEKEMGQLDALKEYCDAAEKLLDSKAFTLRIMMKD